MKIREKKKNKEKGKKTVLKNCTETISVADCLQFSIKINSRVLQSINFQDKSSLFH